MSVYKKYKSLMILDVDFRRGNFFDRSVVHTLTKQGAPYVMSNGIKLPATSAFVRVGAAGSLNIGTSDFTVLTKFTLNSTTPDFSAIIGDAAGFAGFTAMRVQPTVGAVSMKFDGTTAPTSGNNMLVANRYNIISYTADRDGLMRFYRSGLFFASANIAAAAAVDLKTTGNCDIGRYADNASFNILGTIEYIIVIKALLTATEIAQITDELNQHPEKNAWSRADADGAGNGEIYFKGELAAIANEVTIASGYLENTGVQILSGSFKMITEKNSGRIEKVIECVTDGSLYIPQANGALTGWRRYVDSGAGYVEVVTDIAAARTIPLTAGDKLIWASEDERRSLYQEV